MRIALITIGDELLSGRTQDSNANWLGKFLKSKGLNLSCNLTIGDDPVLMENTLKDFSEKYDIVVTTGGLGPTEDDLTKTILAKTFNKQIVYSEQMCELVKQQYQNYGKSWDDIKAKMGARAPEQDYEYSPEDFEPVLNPAGLAPGFSYQTDSFFLCSCPGVPREFREMFEHSLFPKIQRRFQIDIKTNNEFVIRTREIPEEKIFLATDTTLWAQLSKFGKVASLPYRLGVDIVITLNDNFNNQQSKKEIQTIIQQSPIAPNVWQFGNISLEQYIVEKAIDKNITFGFAESCTGGMLAHLITNISGSSKVFFGSIVSYHNSVKVNSLDVVEQSLINHGAVSEQVALEMALGARKKLGVDIAVSTSGIAGPSGGSPEKPVGLVAVGQSNKNESISHLFQYKGDREGLKERFARKALFTLLDEINRF